MSHKQLIALLSSAQKEKLKSSEELALISEERLKFKAMIESWSELSIKLIHSINTSNKDFLSDHSRKSLMALGALEAHLKMALDAKEIFEKSE